LHTHSCLTVQYFYNFVNVKCWPSPKNGQIADFSLSEDFGRTFPPSDFSFANLLLFLIDLPSWIYSLSERVSFLYFLNFHLRISVYFFLKLSIVDLIPIGGFSLANFSTVRIRNCGLLSFIEPFNSIADSLPFRPTAEFFYCSKYCTCGLLCRYFKLRITSCRRVGLSRAILTLS
jgi:hypothetical protein